MAGPYSSANANNYVGVALQPAAGSATAPTLFIPYKDTANFSHGIEGDDVREGGNGPYVARTIKTKHDPAGSFGCAWRPKTGATLAAWFLGGDTAAGTTNQYTHTATFSETLRYLSVEQNLADEATERIIDGFLKSLKISGEGSGDLMLSCDWFGFTPTWGSPTSETYETGVSGSTPGGPYRMDDATYLINASTATNVQSWSLEFSWKYDEDIRLSEVLRTYTQKLSVEASISIKQLMLATGDYRQVPYGTTVGTTASANFYQGGAFNATFSNGLAGTNARSVVFDAPAVDWKDPKYSDINPDGETVYVEFTGTLKKVAGSELASIISVTADTAAYV